MYNLHKMLVDIHYNNNFLRETSEEVGPADTLISDFQPLEL